MSLQCNVVEWRTTHTTFTQDMCVCSPLETKWHYNNFLEHIVLVPVVTDLLLSKLENNIDLRMESPSCYLEMLKGRLGAFAYDAMEPTVHQS